MTYGINAVEELALTNTEPAIVTKNVFYGIPHYMKRRKQII